MAGVIVSVSGGHARGTVHALVTEERDSPAGSVASGVS